MAHKVAWLTKRVKVGEQWTTKRPAFTKSGMLTNKILLNGQNFVLPGVFVVEWYDSKGKRQRKTVGTDTATAQRELNDITRKLQAAAEGFEVSFESPNKKKHVLEHAIADYVAYLRRRKRTEKTIRGIEDVLNVVKDISGGDFLEDLRKTDVTDKFVTHMESCKYAPVTVYDRYAKVVSFLKWCRDPERGWAAPLVRLKDGPAKPHHSGDSDAGSKDPYTPKELTALFAISSAEERLWWLFALQTGAREGEIMHATWRDIDLDNRLFHVCAKDGFTPKDKTNRTVPFGQTLADALKARKESSKELLVFAQDSKPVRHMIRKLKARALEAGLNCGLCRNDADESCADKPTCEHWFLHRFRHTFAIMHLRAGVDVRTVQQWLGHSDLATTSIYLTKIRDASAETQQKVDATFAGVRAFGATVATRQ